MNELLGISYSSVWWAFGFLVAFCLIGTPLDRLMGGLAGKIAGEKGAGKAVHLVLDTLCNCGVLFLLDKLVSSIGIAWWSLAILALVMAAMMVFSNGGE